MEKTYIRSTVNPGFCPRRQPVLSNPKSLNPFINKQYIKFKFNINKRKNIIPDWSNPVQTP